MKLFRLKTIGRFGLLAGIVFLTGCGTTTNSVERAQPQGQRQMVSDKRAVSNSSLNRGVQIVGVNEAMTPGGVIRVQVELQNHSRSLRRFNYRFEWFDTNGMQVSTMSSALIPCQIGGKENKMISGVAPNSNCRDFRIKFGEKVVSIGGINVENFFQAANDTVDSLLASSALNRAGKAPARIAIHRVKNNTGQHVDTDQITKTIRGALAKSGKANSETTGATDADFNLSSEIIETTTISGNIIKRTYSLQLAMSDPRGQSVWKGERVIGIRQQGPI